ncbi:MAG: urease accessory protein UreD [Pseudomonadota bacterium]
MLPSTHGPVPEAVFLNTAGGVTGGDSFTFEGSVESGALCLTTQTAERAYASTGDAANIAVSLSAGPGARLHWLPQETILFDQSHLRRTTRIDAGEGAEVLALEMIVLGRTAMGESLNRFTLRDRREICAPGPVWIDALALDESLIGQAAGVAEARALATLVFWAPGAEDISLDLHGGLHASAWGGKYVIRGHARDLWPLKRALAPVLEKLMGGPLPRVWAV